MAKVAAAYAHSQLFGTDGPGPVDADIDLLQELVDTRLTLTVGSSIGDLGTAMQMQKEFFPQELWAAVPLTKILPVRTVFGGRTMTTSAAAEAGAEQKKEHNKQAQHMHHAIKQHTHNTYNDNQHRKHKKGTYDNHCR